MQTAIVYWSIIQERLVDGLVVVLGGQDHRCARRQRLVDLAIGSGADRMAIGAPERPTRVNLAATTGSSFLSMQS
jgi:hypothetical protein